MSNIMSVVEHDNFEPDWFLDEEYNSSQTIENTKQNESEAQIPQDKNNWIFYAIFSLGTSVLLPWYFFVICNDYWMYRFRDLKSNSHNFHLFLEDVEPGSNRTRLQADFTSYISIASTVPSTLFLFVNIFYLRKFSIDWRIVSSYAVILLCFIETTVLVLIDSDSWQLEFFVVTLLTAVFLSMATAMLQAALSGIIMRFPVAYVTAFSSGQSFAGIFASIAVLLTLLVDSSPTKSTFVYFIFADISIAASFLCFLAIQQNDFYTFYVGNIRRASRSIQYRRIESEISIVSNSIGYWSIQKKIWTPSISVFITYIVSGMLYPSIAVLVCSVNMGRHSSWNEKYFIPVVTYLSYSIFEYVGRMCSGIVQQPKGNLATWFSILRIVFIPLLMFCNAEPRHHLPVLIDSDWIYSLIIITLAFSGGYISSLAFILLPERVYTHELEVACTILAIWFGLSISIGSILSLSLISLL